MRRKISNEFDFLVARSEAETDKAREILESARRENDYYREKIAAKLVEFCEHAEKAARLYAEAKSEYPDLAGLIEKRWPHYRALADEARAKLADLQDENG